MTYSEVISNISSNILLSFDEVYHSAEIVTTDKQKFPAIINADEWISLVPTDQREIIYIRRNGDDEAEETRVSSCGKSYRMKTPMRIVFFKDHAKNPEEIIFKLMQGVLTGQTKLKSVIRDKWKLQKEESSGDYNFGATTVYFALDIYIMWDLLSDTCEHDFCVDIPNPYKKELCL